MLDYQRHKKWREKKFEKKEKNWGKVIQRIEISSNFALGFKSN